MSLCLHMRIKQHGNQYLVFININIHMKRHSQRSNFQPKWLLAIVLVIWNCQILITASISPQTLAIVPVGNNLFCPFEEQRPATGAKYSGEPFLSSPRCL